MNPKDLEKFIRDVVDFPKPGIVFKDITPLLGNGKAMRATTALFAERYAAQGITKVAGIESRGFIFGAALANAMGVGMVPIRKPGKLPYETIGMDYALEYGTDRVEVHSDAFSPDDRVLLIDDLLATGGTAAATIGLIEQLGCEVVEAAFLIELTFLKGRERLGNVPIHALIQY